MLALGARHWMLVAAGAVALTLAVETEIAQIPLARISDPRDVMADALGALLGIALGAALDAALSGGRDHRDWARTTERTAAP